MSSRYLKARRIWEESWEPTWCNVSGSPLKNVAGFLHFVKLLKYGVKIMQLRATRYAIQRDSVWKHKSGKHISILTLFDVSLYQYLEYLQWILAFAVFVTEEACSALQCTELRDCWGLWDNTRQSTAWNLSCTRKKQCYTFSQTIEVSDTLNRPQTDPSNFYWWHL